MIVKEKFQILIDCFRKFKFEVCSCSRARDIEELPKFKSKSRDLGHAPVVP